MKTRHILPILFVAILIALLSGCDGLFGNGLSAVDRVDAFLASINADSQDIAAIKEHFSPASTTYQTIDESYWDATLFDATSRPTDGFVFGDYTEDSTNDGGYASGTTVTTTFTSLDVTAAPTTIVLVPDSNVFRNWLIREIDVNGNVIRNLK